VFQSGRFGAGPLEQAQGFREALRGERFYPLQVLGVQEKGETSEKKGKEVLVFHKMTEYVILGEYKK
jgi:hypothetical protein